MEQIFKALSESPLVQVGGLLLGAIGIILAIVFYIRSRRVSRVRYDSSARALVEGLSGALDGIEVRYKGSPQDRITVSRFAFWNAGTETIRANDFTDDRLRIAGTPGIKILDHRIVESNDETNKIEVGQVEETEEETSIGIGFDYLDSNDGAVAQLVHDGPALTRFRLAGSLKGNCSIGKSQSPAYRVETVYRAIPVLGALMKSKTFGWLGALMYLAIGIVTLVAPFRGASWWLLAPSAFCFFGTWAMFYAYVAGQVPSHFQRELGELPRANKAIDSDEE